MAAEKTRALMLRIHEFSETSCVVTMFTEGFGKIGALAKGARRPKSPFESAIDLLTLSRIVFLHKSSDTLDLLTEAKLERRFRAGTRDLARLYAGYYVAELLNEMTDHGDPHPQLFQRATETLRRLDGDDRVASLILQFELTALRLLGHFPALRQCTACGKVLHEGSRVWFGTMSGGVLCGVCRAGHHQVIHARAESIEIMHLLGNEDDPTAAPPSLDDKFLGEVRGILNLYICNLLGKRPRLHRYLSLLAS